MKVLTTNDESLDAEDNTESPHTTIEPRGGNHGHSDASQTHSITTCEDLKLKTGQVVTYTV